MRIFSYRNKSRLKKALLILLCALLAAGLLFLGVFLYLQRFLVYTPDGAHLDFSGHTFLPSGQQPDDSQTGQETLPVEIVQGDSASSMARQQFSGRYLTTAMLSDPEAVQAALEEDLPEAVMLDMKSIFGNFYYASDISGAVAANADLAAIRSLIETLGEKGVYLIARIPAFSDNNFALANQSSGLPLSSGALWMDANGCYWLDPTDPLVVYYLESIAAELAALGFQEVVFDQFFYPDSDHIVYPDGFSKEEALSTCAKTLVQDLSQSGIAVSFGTQEPSAAAEGSRVYLTCSDGAEAASLAQPFSGVLDDPASQIVFITASRDTRFQSYCVLLPLLEE